MAAEIEAKIREKLLPAADVPAPAESLETLAGE